MKHYIYIDKEILNSYISQIYGGILSKNHTERSNSVKDEKISNQLDSKIRDAIEGRPLIDDKELLTIDSIRNTDVNKEVVEKIYHDNLLDKLIEYVENNEVVIKDIKNVEEGKFVFLSIPFNFVNHEYLNSISNPKFKDAFDKITNATNGGNTNGNKDAKKAMDLISNFTKFFESCFPTKQLIVTDSLIIPLNVEWLREAPEMIDFKYGGNVKVFGIVSKDCSKGENYFGLYNEQFGKSMKEVKDKMYDIFLPNYKSSFTITPIALYFENI